MKKTIWSAAGVGVVAVGGFLLTNPDKVELYWGWVKTIAGKVDRQQASPTNDDQARLLSIVSGDKSKPLSDCVADDDGSRVQIFEHGLFLIHFSTNMNYAIFTEFQDEISWIRNSDESHGNGDRTTCAGIEDENKLSGGFRYLYCKPSSTELRQKLGKPSPGEIPAWVQFQNWPGGLLIYGVPVRDAVDVRENVQRNIDIHAFNGLYGFFLDSEQSKPDGLGRKLIFVPQASRQNVYCTSLWYPLSNGVPVDLINLDGNECLSKEPPTTYTKPTAPTDKREHCSIFGRPDD